MKGLITIALFLGLAAAAQAKVGPQHCYIRTYNGHYLTAVGGGNRTYDAIHADAVQPRSWERFTLVDADKGTPIVTYGVVTKTGNYLTAVGGGGRIYEALHTDATVLRDWEEFQFISLGGGWYAIKTYKGNYLTAVNGGGLTYDGVHSDATRIGNWEKFRMICGVK